MIKTDLQNIFDENRSENGITVKNTTNIDAVTEGNETETNDGQDAPDQGDTSSAQESTQTDTPVAPLPVNKNKFVPPPVIRDKGKAVGASGF